MLLEAEAFGLWNVICWVKELQLDCKGVVDNVHAVVAGFSEYRLSFKSVGVSFFLFLTIKLVMAYDKQI